MTESFVFDCGCKFSILEKNNNFPKINFSPKLSNISLECQKTWDLISTGNTKGCFQLESRLGQTMARKLKPQNIQQLSGLISILRPGCISGDTKISVKKYTHSDGNDRYENVRIRDIANNPDKFSHLLSYDENSGVFVSNKMLAAFYTGNKECFRVIINSSEGKTTKYGEKDYKLECTNDHKLLTPTGWKSLKDIQIGERILVRQRRGPIYKKTGIGTKSFRRRCYNTYIEKCIFCDWNLGSLDVNHITENRLKNNDPENLCYMCPNHHRQFTEKSISISEVNEARKKHKLPFTQHGRWVTLKDKISIGIKDVYDISMDAPHHNFIAGGVVVHNCLEAMRDGKSVSNHYIDKKNGLESIDYFHPALEPILKDTYSEMIYQEQAMSIAKELAGFNLKEADDLRKAIGKKQADKMAKVKKKFINGAKKVNLINEIEAEQIFEWIEKSQRYLFNASHSISYAMNAFLSAYAKAHFPRVFFASYLRFAKDKIDPQQEIKELVRNAIEMDIEVRIPDFRNLNELFILKDKKIYFGLTDIKGVGKSVYNKIIEITNSHENITTLSWSQILCNVLLNINSTASKALISCGSLDYFKKNRSELLFEYEILSGLTNRELTEFCNYSNIRPEASVIEVLRHILDNTKLLKKRKEVISNYIHSLINPPYSLIDKIEWLSDSENDLLGVSITCSKLDVYDITAANCNCKTFKTSFIKENIIIAGEISQINITKTKTGKNPGLEMAFVTIEDQFGTLDSVIFFPEAFSQYKTHLFIGNILVFAGNRSKSKDSFIVEKCFIPSS